MGGPSRQYQDLKRRQQALAQKGVNVPISQIRSGAYVTNPAYRAQQTFKPIDINALKQPYAYGGDHLANAFNQARAASPGRYKGRDAFQRFALGHQLSGIEALADAGILYKYSGSGGIDDRLSHYESQLANFDVNALTPEVVERAGGREAVYTAFNYGAQGLKNIADKRSRRLPTKIGGAILSGIVGAALFGPGGYPGAFAAGATSSIGTGEDPIIAGTKALAAKGLGDATLKGVKKIGDKVSLGLKSPTPAPAQKVADPFAGLDAADLEANWDVLQYEYMQGPALSPPGTYGGYVDAAALGVGTTSPTLFDKAKGAAKGAAKKVGGFLASPTARLGAATVSNNLGYTAQEYAIKQAGTAAGAAGALNAASAAAQVPSVEAPSKPKANEAAGRGQKRRGALRGRKQLLLQRNLNAATTKSSIGLRDLF